MTKKGASPSAENDALTEMGSRETIGIDSCDEASELEDTDEAHGAPEAEEANG